MVLEPTRVENKSDILDALDNLQAGGSTNGEAGIRAAYDMAESAFRADGVNRVVLCSDGDMNVGLTGDALIELIEEFREKDIFLTTLGVGMGNYQDDLWSSSRIMEMEIMPILIPEMKPYASWEKIW